MGEWLKLVLIGLAGVLLFWAGMVVGDYLLRVFGAKQEGDRGE